MDAAVFCCHIERLVGMASCVLLSHQPFGACGACSSVERHLVRDLEEGVRHVGRDAALDATRMGDVPRAPLAHALRPREGAQEDPVAGSRVRGLRCSSSHRC